MQHPAAQAHAVARAVRPRSYAPGRLAPGLRIISHNIRGFGSEIKPRDGSVSGSDHLHALFACWADLRAHVICIQETHLNKAAFSGEPGCPADVERRLQLAATASLLPGYKAFWSHNTQSNSGGVGILIRSDLFSDGSLQVRELGIQSSPDGRLLAVPVSWQGHDMTLMSVYMPAKDRASQLSFLTNIYTPFLHTLPATAQLVMAGDYNVTFDQQNERFRQHNIFNLQAARNHNSSEQLVVTNLQQLCTAADVKDAFRVRHPTRRVFTWCAPARGVASFIDRIFVSSSLLNHVHQCTVETSSPSDHRPMVLHLRPARIPHPPGPGLRRCRTDFQKDPALLQHFLGWAGAQVAAAPASDHDLLTWWPGFKSALAHKLGELGRVYTQQLRTATLPVQQAAVASRAATDAFARPQQGETVVAMQSALQTALQADRACQAAHRPAALSAAQRSRHTWLHSGERASTLLTALTNPPASSRAITVIQATRGGGLITTPSAIAAEAARFFSDVSKQPVCSIPARASVLDAIRIHATSLTPAEVRAASATEVLLGEVKVASKHQRPGSAPGPDGLPPGIWRLTDPADILLPPQDRAGGVLRPLLVRLFTAIGRTGRVPHGFLDGAVVILYKKGNVLFLINYRPITLLNTDHRLLAKVLANRLAPALARAIGPEQSAFLPGRHIGDRVLFLQLLAAALTAQRFNTTGAPCSAAVVFLDIAKAFDTLDRGYICDVLRTIGAGDFVPWVNLLLTGTQAVVVVNGMVSPPANWEAGVRQGCPLAPLLYIIAAWGLACHLKASPGIGVDLPGCGTQHCGQFADDTQVLVPSALPQHIQPLITAMDVYREATGQGINLGKCEILPVGVTPPSGDPGGTGTRVHGMPVVATATALGMVFSNSDGMELPGAPALGPPPVPVPAPPGMPAPAHHPDADWPSLVSRARSAFTRVSRLGLSVFGRGFAAGSYCLSKLFYHMEFADTPAAVMSDLESLAKGLVDRGLPPGTAGDRVVAGPAVGPVPARLRHLPGVHSALLAGSPREGGFGLLPFAQHILARHAVWALRLIHHLLPAPLAAPARPPTVPNTPSWVPLAASILWHLCPGHHPSLALLACANQHRQNPAISFPPMATGPLPGPLHRMVAALSALGPPTRIVAEEPVPGPWCKDLPLWGNPGLGLEVQDVGPHWLHYDHLSGLFPRLPGLHSLSDLLSLYLRLAHPTQRTASGQHHIWRSDTQPGYMQHVWGTAISTHEPVLQLMRLPNLLRDTVQSFYQRIPASWRAQAVSSGVFVRAPQASAHWADTSVVSAARTALEGWGWVPCCPAGDLLPAKAVPLLGGTQRVRNVTSVLLHPVIQQRVARHQQFVTAAAEPTAWWSSAEAVPAPRLPLQHSLAELDLLRRTFVSSLPVLWAVPLDNRHKDAFWRLSVNGVPGAGGHDICTLGPCPCGWCVDPLICDTLDRKRLLGAPAIQAHTFWECPVAQAVILELANALPVGTQLHRMHVWLGISPCPEILLPVWQVVCMSAVAAMERGRRFLWSLHFTSVAAQPVAASNIRQQTLAEAWGLQPAALALGNVTDQRSVTVQHAARASLADFWTRLDDFVTVLPDCGKVWHGSAGINHVHPFICTSPGLPQRFRINIPVTIVANPVVVLPAADP